jgi:hypothetical protein
MKIDNIINKAVPTINNNSISDSEGLSKAYNAPNSIHIEGNEMYIAGTHNMRDVWDDVSKIPFWGDVRNSERYQQAEEALRENPQVDTVIAHSLGSSVGAELNKQHNNQFKTKFYGSPFLDFSFAPSKDPNNIRYRHPGDIISMWDTGAINEESNTINNLVNPHYFPDFLMMKIIKISFNYNV